MVLAAGLSWVLLLTVSPKAAVRVLARAAAFISGIACDLFPCSLSRPLAGLSCSPASGQGPPSVPCHVGLPIKQITTNKTASIRASREEGKGWPSRRKPEPFCNLIYYVTSHHFCHILMIRNEPPSPTHTQRGGDDPRHKHHEARMAGGRFRGCLPQHASALPPKPGCLMCSTRWWFLPTRLAKRIMGISWLPKESRIGPNGSD